MFGSTEKTEASEEFKQLQMATETRKEGIENMHGSLAGYATTLDGKDPDKKLPTISTADKKTPCLTGLGKALVQQGRLQGEDNNYGTDSCITNRKLSIIRFCSAARGRGPAGTVEQPDRAGHQDAARLPF